MGMQFFKGFSAYKMVYYKLSYTEGQEKLYNHQFKNVSSCTFKFEALCHQAVLSNNGVLLLQGALEMRNKTVADRYTPLENVFMLDANCKLDHDTMTQVSAQEFEK